MNDEPATSLIPVPRCEVPRMDRVLKVFAGLEQDVTRLLDIGCGEGSITLRLKHACNAVEVYGVDEDSDSITLAKEKGIKACILDVDNSPYPFPNDYFDAVFAGEVLEHLTDPDHFFEEIHRILRKKGTFVITTPNFAAWYNRIALALAFQPFSLDNSWRHANAGKMLSFRRDKTFADGLKGEIKSAAPNMRHEKLYTRRALKAILKLYDFHIVQCAGYPFLADGRSYLAYNSIELIMDRLGAGAGILISCYKK
jgi:methionine biosynthesis protein MetW